MTGWLTRDQAEYLARMVAVASPRPPKSVHVQGMGTGGRVKITLFLTPLPSNEIPEPEPYVFPAGELQPAPRPAPALGEVREPMPQVSAGDPDAVARLVDWPQLGEGRGRVYDLPGPVSPQHGLGPEPWPSA